MDKYFDTKYVQNKNYIKSKNKYFKIIFLNIYI